MCFSQKKSDTKLGAGRRLTRRRKNQECRLAFLKGIRQRTSQKLSGLSPRPRRLKNPSLNYPLPFFNCCFHPSTRALLPSASASGTIPFF